MCVFHSLNTSFPSTIVLHHSPIKYLADKHQMPSLLDYQNPSSYTHDVSTSSDPSDSYHLALAPYRQYSPCQLRLEDPHQSSEAVTSVAIFISDKTNATTMGVEWNADDPAPKVTVDEGVAIAKTGSASSGHVSMRILMWGLAEAVAAAMVLL